MRRERGGAETFHAQLNTVLISVRAETWKKKGFVSQSL